MKRKLLILFLTLCMVLTYMPVAAFAQEEEPVQTEQELPGVAVSSEEEAEEAPAEEAAPPAAEEISQPENEPEVTEPENSEQPKSEVIEEAQEEAVQEEAQEEPQETETEDIAFNASKSDYLAYNPLYIMKYGDSSLGSAVASAAG